MLNIPADFCYLKMRLDFKIVHRLTLVAFAFHPALANKFQMPTALMTSASPAAKIPAMLKIIQAAQPPQVGMNQAHAGPWRKCQVG
jgi:hypothetical protein